LIKTSGHAVAITVGARLLDHTSGHAVAIMVGTGLMGHVGLDLGFDFLKKIFDLRMRVETAADNFRRRKKTE
jgi:hypothetical protein